MNRPASVLFLTAIAGAFLAAFPSVPRAQIDTRSAAPIDITADEAEVIQSKCLAIWRGAAEALQGDARLRADAISIYSLHKSGQANGQPACGGTDRIVAEGNVYYVTPQEDVRGDRAVYTEATDQILITGDVIIVQGKNVARGERLLIDVATHQATMLSSAKGAARTGRVRGVFFPAQSEKSSTSPPANQPQASPR
ncbi:MAG: LptA/OstA family protein [Caulobacteraceae bacterium]